jgi:hypothetical protein
MSGRRDLNSRLSAPKADALTGLRYAPKSSFRRSIIFCKATARWLILFFSRNDNSANVFLNGG